MWGKLGAGGVAATTGLASHDDANASTNTSASAENDKGGFNITGTDVANFAIDLVVGVGNAGDPNHGDMMNMNSLPQNQSDK